MTDLSEYSSFFIGLKCPDLTPVLDEDKFDKVLPGNYHITLKYLGKPSWEKIERFSDHLKPKMAEFPSFKVQIGYYGYFEVPRALWLAAEDQSGEIEACMEQVCRLMDVRPNKQYGAFVPHITVARAYPRNECMFNERTIFQEVSPESYKASGFPDSFMVEEVILYGVMKNPKRYLELDKVKLSKPFCEDLFG